MMPDAGLGNVKFTAMQPVMPCVALLFCTNGSLHLLYSMQPTPGTDVLCVVLAVVLACVVLHPGYASLLGSGFVNAVIGAAAAV